MVHNATTWQLNITRNIKGNLIQHLCFFPPLFKSGLDRFYLAYMIRGVTVRTLLKILPTFWPETHLYPPPSPVNHVGISISGKQKLHTASNFVFTGRRSAGGHQQCPMICGQERVSMGSASSLIYNIKLLFILKFFWPIHSHNFDAKDCSSFLKLGKTYKLYEESDNVGLKENFVLYECSLYFYEQMSENSLIV